MDLDDLVNIEQRYACLLYRPYRTRIYVVFSFSLRFYDEGYAEGFEHGRKHGHAEGHAMGQKVGYELWEEIGFYEGFASMCVRFVEKGLLVSSTMQEEGKVWSGLNTKDEYVQSYCLCWLSQTDVMRAGG